MPTKTVVRHVLHPENVFRYLYSIAGSVGWDAAGDNTVACVITISAEPVASDKVELFDKDKEIQP